MCLYDLNSLNSNGVCIRHLGHRLGINARLMQKIIDAVHTTRDNSTLVLNVAFNYGGRNELVRAVKHIIDDGLSADKIDEELIGDYLYTVGQPDPDLIIRTSGEYRISNFLVWQSAYSEWYFTSKLWPDFNKEELRRAIKFFNGRERRFGQISDQIK